MANDTEAPFQQRDFTAMFPWSVGLRIALGECLRVPSGLHNLSIRAKGL